MASDVDKAPFFVTLAVAIVGWTASYVVERVTKSPTLEYERIVQEALPTKGEPEARVVRYKITNLARDTAFKDLKVILMAPDKTRLVQELTEIHPFSPATEGDEPWEFKKVSRATYTIARVQPNWSYEIQAGYVGENPPRLRFSTEETIYATRPNWETFCVRREPWIILAIAIFWGGFVVWYAISRIVQSFRGRPRFNAHREADDGTG